ncbi:carboxypeptidase S [Pisolithus croceorrhizus]|nr:carboxypeptidase S [Pisolithus croceorrhizus]
MSSAVGSIVFIDNRSHSALRTSPSEAMVANETTRILSIPTKLLPAPVSTQSQSRCSSTRAIGLFAVIGALGLLVNRVCWHDVPVTLLPTFDHGGTEAPTNICPQVPELIPQRDFDIWESLGATYDTDIFKAKAVRWLAGAVQVPTESYDSLGPVGTDPRWDKFYAFHAYLQKAFPLVHAELELTKVNTHGLIFVWNGSNEGLKPLLLAAHQDVVPVEPTTVDKWTHPPFSGHFDGTFVWGRGSCDDKSGLIGIMSAIETLLATGYEPTRTVVLAFGFDEESGGEYGAQTLAIELEAMFGQNGYAMIVDEGGGYGEQYGRILATPGVAEKGSVNVRIEVSTPGGHSSLPPPHTSIGILAELLVKIEANPFKVHLTRDSPPFRTVQCLAAHAPNIPDNLRRDIMASAHSDKALRAAEDVLFTNSAFKNLVGTTQAIDIIQGGVKVNALPEQAWAVVNHRISTESSVAETEAHDTDVLKSLASRLNLTYTAFGKDVDCGNRGDPIFAYGNLTLSEAFESGLEPAPTTPFEGDDATPYRILSGSIKTAFNRHRNIGGDNDVIVVSPGIMPGNTDTKFYWNLTPHIFRYGHIRTMGSLPPNIHTVDEAMSIDNFLEIIRFFTTLIMNVDESALP